ncbi:patatin-like phospholipase family protein [Streptomyces sp. SD15]
MTTAIVLGGGGARGDFEVGALRFLYDQGVMPDVLVGTSVGAINAAKLAEGDPSDDPTRGLKGLESIWLSLRTDTDMYVEAAWLSRIDPELRAYITGYKLEPGITPPTTFPGAGDLTPALELFSKLAFLMGDGAKVLTALQELIAARSLYELTPIADKLRTQLDTTKINEWVDAGGRLRLATVSLEAGELRFVSESGRILDRSQTHAVPLPPAMRPECSALASQISSLEQEIRTLHADLSDSVGAKPFIVKELRRLLNELNGKRRDLAECLSSQPTNPLPLTVSLREGVLASATLPGIFKAVRLGDEMYVDGGVREIIPVQAAVQLGADRIYAIASSREGVEPGSYAAASATDIASRSLLDVALDEIARDDMLPDLAQAQLTVIRPTQNLHDLYTVDPGLIRISMAYGYMRAADAWHGYGAADKRWQLSDQISLLRREIWHLECLLTGQVPPTEKWRSVQAPDLSLAPTVAELKSRLQVLVNERQGLGGALPADATQWALQPEDHRAPIPWGPAAQGDDMQPGETLRAGQSVSSPDGAFTFVYQGDGNLVLYRNSDGAATWASLRRPEVLGQRSP